MKKSCYWNDTWNSWVTFGGNPLAMTVGNTVMDIIFNKKFLNNVKNLSKYFFQI